MAKKLGVSDLSVADRMKRFAAGILKGRLPILGFRSGPLAPFCVYACANPVSSENCRRFPKFSSVTESVNRISFRSKSWHAMLSSFVAASKDSKALEMQRRRLCYLGLRHRVSLALRYTIWRGL